MKMLVSTLIRIDLSWKCVINDQLLSFGESLLCGMSLDKFFPGKCGSDFLKYDLRIYAAD